MEGGHLSGACEEAEASIADSAGAQVKLCQVGEVPRDHVDHTVGGHVGQAERGEGGEARQGGAEGVT